jgi:hypothetical protein
MPPELKVEEPDDDLIDVGDEDEVETEILLDDENENPNVSDQLEASSEVEDDDDGGSEKDERTPEQKLNEFLDANPDVSELRSTDIKGRIGKLTYEKNEAERQREAAVEFARAIQIENANLKTKQQHQDGVFINEHKARLETQLDVAKKAYQEAHEEGDAGLIAEANALIARATAELAQAEQTETRFSRFVKSNRPPSEEVIPYEPPSDPNAQPAQPAVSPKAEAWAERNSWFGEDEEMTNAALNIHKSLVTQEGYLPSGDGYYNELDLRMRKNYPERFKTVEKPELNAQQTVTPTGGGNSTPRKRGKRRIHLTPSQVAVAKKLGVPLEEYAKYV